MFVKPSLQKEYQKSLDKNNKDFYSAGVIKYINRWTKLMEDHKGKLTGKFIYECSNKADTEGITGFMYSCAKATITKYWAYGDEFKKALDEYENKKFSGWVR